MRQTHEGRTTVTMLAQRPSWHLSRRWLLLVVAAGLTALALMAFTSRVDAAGPIAVAGPDAIVLQAESDDSFHVSDEGLAVAIFIPSVFILATGLLIAWAYANREKDSDQQ